MISRAHICLLVKLLYLENGSSTALTSYKQIPITEPLPNTSSDKHMMSSSTLPSLVLFLTTGLRYPTVQTASELGFDPERHGECSICFEESPLLPFLPGRIHHNACKILACGHWFGTHCLHTWLQDENTCPMCRRQLFLRYDYDKAYYTRSHNLNTTLTWLNEAHLSLLQARTTEYTQIACDIYTALKRTLVAIIERNNIHLQEDERFATIIPIHRTIKSLFEIREYSARSRPCPSHWHWGSRPGFASEATMIQGLRNLLGRATSLETEDEAS